MDVSSKRESNQEQSVDIEKHFITIDCVKHEVFIKQEYNGVGQEDEETGPRHKRGRPFLTDEERRRRPKGIKAHLRQKFKFECPRCKRLCANKDLLKSHLFACVFCEKCQQWVYRIHLEKCTGKERKSTRVLCHLCHRLRRKSTMGRHMKRIHGLANWKRAHHPECISEDEYLEDLKRKEKLEHLAKEVADLKQEKLNLLQLHQQATKRNGLQRSMNRETLFATDNNNGL